MSNCPAGPGLESDNLPDAAVGRTLPLSPLRRTMCDLLAFAKAIPTVPVQRRMNVSRAARARAGLAAGAARPGWCAIFTKAYALTARRFPELRRAYLSFPRPHLYEHPQSIASVAIEATYQGEHVVFWAHLRGPETQSLRALQGHLRRFKETPADCQSLCRRAMLVGRFPRPLRRLAWWIGLNSSGPKRAKRLGTFGVSVYSGLGAESLHPISPLTGTLNYGTIEPDGSVTVRIVYDHRVVDGATVARALAWMEQCLNRDIVAELEQQAHEQAA
jgi:pyruvate/2-oxoglutarate dehydrogenase complex dihydrolipoamide acyltransferase (E2) component